VARVAAFHDGRKWRFARDEAKPVMAAMFNRRSVTGNRAKQSWQPQRDDDADSVRIIYVNDTDNTEAYIERRFDILTGEIVTGEIGNIPIEIKLAGCRNSYQAENRANLEIRRIAYQRRVVKETTYRDALEIELLDRVGWVDINDIDTFDGEIMGINASVYDTTERFLPELGRSYVVFLTDEEGYPSNTVPCDPRTDTEFGFIATGISGAYIAIGDQQVGSRYFIADADDLASSNFTLKSRTPNTDGTVEIELVEYKPEMYELDALSASNAAPIIGAGLVALDVAQAGFDAECLLTFKDNGEIDLNGKIALWYSGGVTIGVGSSFEICATLVSGSSSGTFDEWVSIENVSWGRDRYLAEGSGVNSTVISFTIRQILHKSNTTVPTKIGIKAAIASPVVLPDPMVIDSVSSVGGVSPRIDILSNGLWRGSDGTFGAYTTIVDFIGELYEVRATSLVGALDLGVADAWVNLGGAGASFSITGSAGEIVTFDLELREVADTLNTATSSVTLSITALV